MVSAPAWDGTGCEFDSWQCRIYIPCSLSLRLLGSLRGSWVHMAWHKNCVKKKKKRVGSRYLFWFPSDSLSCSTSPLVWSSVRGDLSHLDYLFIVQRTFCFKSWSLSLILQLFCFMPECSRISNLNIIEIFVKSVLWCTVNLPHFTPFISSFAFCLSHCTFVCRTARLRVYNKNLRLLFYTPAAYRIFASEPAPRILLHLASTFVF